MGATVHLNGRPLGAVRSQFLRYTFDVGSALAADGGTNHLAVNFTDKIDSHGRYAACTGGEVSECKIIETLSRNPAASSAGR